MRTEFNKERTALKAKFSKYGAKQLLKTLPNRTGLEAEVITEILVSRGVIEAPEKKPKAKTYTPKADSPKSGKSESTKMEPVGFEVLDVAKANKGKTVTFHCKKLDKNLDGVITGVRLDKRSNLIQYRIKTSEGMFGKGIDSDDLKFKS